MVNSRIELLFRPGSHPARPRGHVVVASMTQALSRGPAEAPCCSGPVDSEKPRGHPPWLGIFPGAPEMWSECHHVTPGRPLSRLQPCQGRHLPLHNLVILGRPRGGSASEVTWGLSDTV